MVVCRKFIYLVTIFLFSISCGDVYKITQEYTVAGEKTSELTISFSDADGITTIKIPPEKLTWTTNVTLEGRKHRHKEWFLSAESASDGALMVKIGTDKYTTLNTGVEVSSNYTDNNRYIYTILKSAR